MRERTTSREWLAGIAAGAATIDERIAGEVDIQPDDHLATIRLERWIAKVAEGDRAAFRRRLAASGWDEARARTALGRARWPAARALPAWSRTLGAASDAAAALGADCLTRAVPGVSSATFETLQAPFVLAASDALEQEIVRHDLVGTIAPGASAPALAQLLSSLSDTAAAVNYAQFSQFRRGRLGRLGELMVRSDPQPGRELYDEYESTLLADAFQLRFAEYPFLARRLATSTHNLVAGIIEVLVRRRLDADRLAETFALPADARVVRIEPTAGDTHAGRSVLRLEFDNGIELAYKPRPLQAELLWGAVLRSVAKRVGDAPVTLDSGAWGWSQWVHHRPCENVTEVRSVFRSAGMLLAIGHALGTVDLHSENVVVDGRSMHVVDAEMAIQPAVDRLLPVRADLPPPPGSVLDVGVLPSYAELRRDEYVDVGVLGEHADSVVRWPGWSSPGSDAIVRSEREQTMAPVAASEIWLAGERVRPEDHTDALVGGFTAAYLELRRLEEPLITRVADAAHASLRVVVQPTWLYVRCLRRLADTDALTGGVEQQIQAEVLRRQLARLDSSDPLHEVRAREVAALCEGDVPYFTCRADSTQLCDCEVTTGRTSAIDNVRRRLRSLSGDDLARQCELIKASITLRTFGLGDRNPMPPPPVTTVPTTEDQALNIAVQIGDRLLADGARGPDGGGLWWHGARPVRPGGRRAPLHRQSWDLYAGAPGIAASFAALFAATGDHRWQRAAHEACRPYLGAVADDATAFVAVSGFGAHTGAAGTAFGFRVVAGVAELPDLDDAARSIVAALPSLDTTSSEDFDVIGGLAGTILATLAIAEQPSDELRSAIGQWSVYLANSATPPIGDPDGAAIAWPSVDAEAELSYSHGSAGIIDALVSAASSVDDERAKTCSRVAGEAQRTHLARLGNRARPAEPAHRSHDPLGWCRGVTGHLYSLERVEDATNTAVQALRHRCASTDGDSDISLCCGLAGRLEYWRGRARRSPEDRLASQTAHDLADRLVTLLASSSDVERYGRAPNLPMRPHASVPAPGLFQGDAGVIWSLAALAAPSLPVLHFWETRTDLDAPQGEGTTH